ncbi:MAG: hypothetical protein A2033_12775 [Bacteroidetes bacterium GWA2_31_9]|nr:MAG: hypothetical protein A2033_12775 [Bacteroidetes bacterium GWA2_31_9]
MAQNISIEEKKADSLSKNGDFANAIEKYNDILKIKQLQYNDSLRLFMKKFEVYYMLLDSNKLNENIQNIELIVKIHSDIEKNNDIYSQLEFIRGKYFNQKKDISLAIKYINNAIVSRLKFANDSILAIMYSLKGSLYLKNNYYNKSLVYFNRAIKCLISNKIYDKNILRILLNISYIYWVQQDFIKFKHVNEIALKMSKMFKIDDKYIAQTQMNLGTYYLNQSDYFNAYKSFSKISELKNIYQQTILRANYYIAFTLKEFGDFKLSNIKHSYLISNEAKLSSDIVAFTLKSQALNFYFLSEYDSSLFYIKKSIKENEKSKTIKPHILYYNLAKIYSKLNFQDSAYKSINLALRTIQTENILDANYADILFQKGLIINNKNSLEFLNKAINIMKNISGLKHSRTTYLLIERGLFQKNNKIQSLQDFQQALISVDLDFNSTNIFENPKCEHILSSVNLAKALRYKSEALEQIYLQNDSIQYLEAAYETAKLLTEQIEKMLMSYPLFESKQFLMDNSANTFSRAQYLGYLCWKKTGKTQYKDENILLAEKSRSAILKSQIQDNEQNGNMLNDSASNTLLEIEQNIAYITEQINENTANKTVIDDLKSQLFELQEQKNKITESLKGEYGNFSNYFKNIPAMSFQDIMKFPAENEAILEYTLCDSIIILNVVAKNKHEIYEIQFDSTFQKYLQSFKNIVVPEDVAYLTLTTQEEINNVGGYLYNALLKPTENIIKGKQLLIVQEPKLGFIPFGAFVKENKYLIEYQPINYMYSINITDAVKQNATNNNEVKMAAFLPGYEFHSSRVTAYSQKYYKTLQALDYKTESEAIYQQTGCDTFLVNNATEENFKKLAGNYTVLHLALHSILNPENFVLSKLCFTAVNDTLNDGIFNLCNVAPLKLNSQLTFLSGCNTGGGQIIAGEGVMSFARGFILAGSKSIIMSLWELNNNSAIDINTGFYKYLGEGYNKAEALQLSKIDYLKKSDNLHRHPFFWSGIVLIGDKEHIEISKPYTLLQKTAIALGILVIVFVIFMFIKKRKQIFNDDTEEEKSDCCG